MARLRILCRGAVQGVGFRPSVHRLATELALAGWVLNGPGGVTIEVEGPPDKVQAFVDSLPRSLPPLARLDELSSAPVPATGEAGFAVRASELGPRTKAIVPPEAALCADCRAEMENPGDRRFRYPFTTCTNCGPRFSLVRALPYDRERTSMACFPLCPDCRREYEDPSDRRFHAEPVCCPACGPKLQLLGADGRLLWEGAEALRAAREALARGSILAVKGLGGFQLACRADSRYAVALLRQRKERPAKPFAVMARDLETAGRLVFLSEEDEAIMLSHRSPVVLAPRRAETPLAEEVAPGLEDAGVMLPTAPIHVELFRTGDYDCLVMTSGNLSEEPICKGNREALGRLGGIADLFLLHDRDVVRRVDDSVVRSSPLGPILVRRARGYVPDPLPLPVAPPEPVLALGGFLQVTACLAVGGQAFLSQHVGDLDGEPARLFLREVACGLEEFLEVETRAIAADLHPDYPSAWLGEEIARERDGRLLRFQHHLAHAAATLAEHGRFPEPGESALALSLDGTGWGPDGAAWGGEWLLVRGDLAWSRLAHLEPLPLVGGEKAVREPWRVLAAALAGSPQADHFERLPVAGLVPIAEWKAVAGLAGDPGWPAATGAGRLFEAAGALLGLTAVNTWEGEAAVRLESLASGGVPAGPWPEVRLDGGFSPIFPSRSLLSAAAQRLADGESAENVAAGFHATFCRVGAELMERVAPPGVRTVALGGGCLVNRLLIRGLLEELAAQGFETLAPRSVPPGDGGLAYGQVVLASAQLARGLAPRLLERP